jgi:hypothetical protein
MLDLVPSSSQGWKLFQPLQCEFIVFSGSTRIPFLRSSKGFGVHSRFQRFFFGNQRQIQFLGQTLPRFWWLEIQKGVVLGGPEIGPISGPKMGPHFGSPTKLLRRNQNGGPFRGLNTGPISGPNFGPIFGSKCSKIEFWGPKLGAITGAQECGSRPPEWPLF